MVPRPGSKRMSRLVFDEEPFVGMRVPVMRWYGGRQLKVLVEGKPISAGQPGVETWKEEIESRVRAARGDEYWPDCESGSYAITLMFAVANPSDVDNLAKPVIDAVARGLFPFRPNDDSCFTRLLVHRFMSERSCVLIRVSRPRPVATYG